MNLLITMPAHDARNATETTYSLWRFAKDANVPHHFEFMNRETSWLYRQLCVERFHARSGYTHWLSLDSDIAFTPHLIDLMLSAKKDVLGAVYPTRSRPTRPAVVMLPDSPAPRDGEIVPVRFVPLGCALVSRAAIRQVATAYPARVQVPRPGGDLAVHQWFATDVLDGALLEPDFGFQQRWRDATGGTVHGLFCGPNEIQHVGPPL